MSSPKTLYSVALTGTKMGQLKHVADQLKVGSRLAIINRPDNSYDSQAMSVHFGDSVTSPQIGWIPAKEFEDKIVKGVLFNLQRHGIPLEAVVVEYEPTARTVVVDVNLIDNCEAAEPNTQQASGV